MHNTWAVAVELSVVLVCFMIFPTFFLQCDLEKLLWALSGHSSHTVVLHLYVCGVSCWWICIFPFSLFQAKNYCNTSIERRLYFYCFQSTHCIGYALVWLWEGCCHRRPFCLSLRSVLSYQCPVHFLSPFSSFHHVGELRIRNDGHGVVFHPLLEYSGFRLKAWLQRGFSIF